MEAIAILLACFNRRETTLECLRTLYGQRGLDQTFTMDVFLVDDGSTDGTGDAVRAAFPQVRVLEGGELYWCRAMHLAWSTAQSETDFDAYIMLNDDVGLHDDAFTTLLETRRLVGGPAIIAGTTSDGATGALTYGGFNSVSRLNPLKLELDTSPDGADVVTMHGNCVLVPRSVVEAIGSLDPTFHHSFGDIDLGLRATAAGFTVRTTSQHVGTCEANEWGTDAHLRPELSLPERVRQIRSIKGLNGRDWRVMARRHTGLLWPVVWISPYRRLVTSWLKATLKRERTSSS